MEVDKKIKLEAIEHVNCLNCGVKVKKESEECFGCFDLQEKFRKANENSAHLESVIGKKDSVIEHLERTVAFTELEKLRFVDEIGKLKQRNVELERTIHDSKEEHEKLIVDNNTLDSEKKKAEFNLEIWKAKCKELEVQVTELENRLLAGTTKADCGTIPTSSTPSKLLVDIDGFKEGQSYGIKPKVKKSLDFSVESRLFQNGITSTPGSRPPVEHIFIDDSDDDLKIVDAPLPNVDNEGQERLDGTPDVADLSLNDNYEPVVEHRSDDEGTSSFTAGQSFRMSKRRKVSKGVAQIVSSESESEDNVPLSRLKSMNRLRNGSDINVMKTPVDGSCPSENSRKLRPRRRLRRVGDIEHNNASGKRSLKSSGKPKKIGISDNLNNTILHDEMEEEEESSREGDSLGGFIVESSDESNSHSRSNYNDTSGSSSDDLSDESETSIGYHEVMSGLRRERKGELKWEYETDMLADFGKSAELCMKAICVLYRQQTFDEKSFKATIHRNGRGFSQIHASMGSALAVFLTGSNPHADMTKTVKELQKFNSKGVELCQELARHYSKQLFEIYKNEEDPFFHP